MKFLSLVALFVLGVCSAYAQRIGVGYYDLDGLYDTIPSLFYNDDDFTPQGRNKWTHERYERQVENTARVIDSMKLDVVGLYGIETQEVVEDIVMSCDLDYTYIHATRNSLDGQDFALLFFGDKLFVEDRGAIDSFRNMLVVRATLADDTPITIILTRSGDDLSYYLSDVEQDELVVILGRLYADQIEHVGFRNALSDNELHGQGNYSSYRGWIMLDRIAVRRDEEILKSGVFIAPWLLNSSTGKPLPTLDRGGYRGGFSKYLPVYTYIR